MIYIRYYGGQAPLTQYKIKDDVKSPVSVRNSHMIEVKRAVRRAILRDKFSDFWKK